MKERRGIDDQKKEEVDIDGCLQEVGESRPVGLGIAIDSGVDCQDHHSHHLQGKFKNQLFTHSSIEM